MTVCRTVATALVAGLCFVALPILGASSPKRQASQKDSLAKASVRTGASSKSSQSSVSRNSTSHASSAKPNFYATEVTKSSPASLKGRSAKSASSTARKTNRPKDSSTVAGPNSVRRLVPREDFAGDMVPSPTAQLTEWLPAISSPKATNSVREIPNLTPKHAVASAPRQSALARLNPINLFSHKQQDEKFIPTGYVQTGIASWYGKDFHGGPTASGERYDMNTLTAAHPSLPFGTLVRVTNLQNGKDVVVRVNNRGPYRKNRIIDLSKEAARQLGMVGAGIAKVRVEVVTAGESIGRWGQATLRKLSHR